VEERAAGRQELPVYDLTDLIVHEVEALPDDTEDTTADERLDLLGRVGLI
jgi:hypothetical protein